MRSLLVFILSATPLFACCPVDKDSLRDEINHEAQLTEFAGVISRQPPAFWEAQLATNAQINPPTIESVLERAYCLDQLNRQHTALDELESWTSKNLPAEAASDLHILRIEIALDLWWLGGTPKYPTGECIRIANDSLDAWPNKLIEQFVAWASADHVADSQRYLPDYFNLRFATDKTTDHDTGELKRRGLDEAEFFLQAQILRHPAWANFDTYYALSMLYVVEGRQNLAYYTRLKCWDMHRKGKHSRISGAAEIDDIAPLTVLRQTRAGVLVPVKVVSDENQLMARRQFAARTAYAARWHSARADYIAQRLGPDTNFANFWADFVAPVQNFPSLDVTTATVANAPESEPAESAPRAVPNEEDPKAEEETDEGSRTVTWLALGTLILVLVLGGITKARMSSQKPDTSEGDA